MARGRGILINDNYELQVLPERSGTGKIVKGFVIGNTLYQNTALILKANKGEFKQQPTLGIGIEGVLLDDDYMDWRRKIRLQLELDEQKVNDIIFNSVDNLVIDAVYNSK